MYFIAILLVVLVLGTMLPIKKILPIESPLWLHQFDAVTERVIDVHPKVAFESVFKDDNPRGAKTCNQRPEFAHEQRRMGLAGWPKVQFNPEMNLDRAGLEPGTAPFGQLRRLLDLRDAE